MIASRYGMRPETIAQANGLVDMNSLEVGQLLTIPLGIQQGGPSDFKIIPDSELVFGPYSITLDLDDFVASQNGYLAAYTEEVDGQLLTGARWCGRVAELLGQPAPAAGAARIPQRLAHPLGCRPYDVRLSPGFRRPLSRRALQAADLGREPAKSWILRLAGERLRTMGTGGRQPGARCANHQRRYGWDPTLFRSSG
jgi:hypothetical protein